jgi:hypothetical protein
MTVLVAGLIALSLQTHNFRSLPRPLERNNSYALPYSTERSNSHRCILLASSAQAGFGAQNAAQAAANSSAASAATAATAPTAPTTAPIGPLTPNLVPGSSAQPFAAPILRDAIKAPNTQETSGASGVNGATGASGSRAIDSFFRISKPQQSSNSLPSPDDKQSSRKSKSSAGKMLFRIMDNVGIPMFLHDTGPDLDPRLRRDYTDPPMPNLKPTSSPEKSGLSNTKNSDNTERNSTQRNSQSMPHKIPESQLEGTEPTPHVQVTP